MARMVGGRERHEWRAEVRRRYEGRKLWDLGKEGGDEGEGKGF